MLKCRTLSAELRAEIFDGHESVAVFKPSGAYTINGNYLYAVRAFISDMFFSQNRTDGVGIIVRCGSRIIFQSEPNGEAMANITDGEAITDAIERLEAASDCLREIMTGLRTQKIISIGHHENLKSKMPIRFYPSARDESSESASHASPRQET